MMTKFLTYITSAGLAVLLLGACEKVIDVDVEGIQPSLVIEGTVTNHADTQVVKLSKSVLVGDRSSFLGVSGAAVTITDDFGGVYTLREREPGIYSTRRLRGLPRRRYNLIVQAEGKEYTASSVMPPLVPIDSVAMIRTVIFNEEVKSVQVLFKDPPGVKNYYRYVMTVNGRKSRNIFVFDDQFNDGKDVSRELLDFDIDIKENDVVTFEKHCIDQYVYRYFKGLDQNESRGGASTTPANPVSNIRGGALGYFSAQTVQREGIIVN